MPEVDFVALVWKGLTSSLDMTAQPGALIDQTVKEITVSIRSVFSVVRVIANGTDDLSVQRIAPILASFCTKAATEVALM